LVNSNHPDPIHFLDGSVKSCQPKIAMDWTMPDGWYHQQLQRELRAPLEGIKRLGTVRARIGPSAHPGRPCGAAWLRRAPRRIRKRAKKRAKKSSATQTATPRKRCMVK